MNKILPNVDTLFATYIYRLTI